MFNNHKISVILLILMSAASLAILAKNQQQYIYKNIQVFPKNISKERMDKEMELFSTSLGVDCGYCHVKNNDEFDFASDAKGHKNEARSMMRMTAEINTKYFGIPMDSTQPYAVMNCYTCHRGEEYPVINWDSSEIKPKLPWNSWK